MVLVMMIIMMRTEGSAVLVIDYNQSRDMSIKREGERQTLPFSAHSGDDTCCFHSASFKWPLKSDSCMAAALSDRNQ